MTRAQADGGVVDAVEQVLRAAEFAKADMDLLAWQDRWVAVDCVVTTAEGRLLTRQEIIELVQSGEYVPAERIAVADVDVRLFGNAAVVTARQTVWTHAEDADPADEFQYTHVWIRRDDRWQLVSAHVTRLGLHGGTE